MIFNFYKYYMLYVFCLMWQPHFCFYLIFSMTQVWQNSYCWTKYSRIFTNIQFYRFFRKYILFIADYPNSAVNYQLICQYEFRLQKNDEPEQRKESVFSRLFHNIFPNQIMVWHYLYSRSPYEKYGYKSPMGRRKTGTRRFPTAR